MRKLLISLILMTILTLNVSFADGERAIQMSQKVALENKIIFLNVSKQFNKDMMILNIADTTDIKKFRKVKLKFNGNDIHINVDDYKLLHKIFGKKYENPKGDFDVIILRRGWIHELAESYYNLIYVCEPWIKADQEDLIKDALMKFKEQSFEILVKNLDVKDEDLKDLKYNSVDMEEALLSTEISNSKVNLKMTVFIQNL